MAKRQKLMDACIHIKLVWMLCTSHDFDSTQFHSIPFDRIEFLGFVYKLYSFFFLSFVCTVYETNAEWLYIYEDRDRENKNLWVKESKREHERAKECAWACLRFSRLVQIDFSSCIDKLYALWYETQ